MENNNRVVQISMIYNKKTLFLRDAVHQTFRRESAAAGLIAGHSPVRWLAGGDLMERIT